MSCLHFATLDWNYSSLPLLQGIQHSPCRQHQLDPGAEWRGSTRGPSLPAEAAVPFLCPVKPPAEHWVVHGRGQTQGQTLATISLHLVSHCTLCKGLPLSHHFKCLTSRGLTSQGIYLVFHPCCLCGHPDVPSTWIWVIPLVGINLQGGPRKETGSVSQKHPCSSPVSSVPQE